MTNSNIKYLRFHPDDNNDFLNRLIDCYRQIFMAEPWNEWKKCPICGKKWGISEKKELECRDFKHCGQQVVDFWPKEKVESDIREEIGSSDDFCVIALDNQGVVGFCWGYLIPPEKLEKKTELPGLASTINENFGDLALVSYQDEIGVLTQYRCQNIGNVLHSKLLDFFRRRGLKVTITRTKSNPPSVAYRWYQRIGYKVIDEYHDTDGRVILASTLEELKA